MTEKIELTINQIYLGGIGLKYDEKDKTMQTTFEIGCGARIEDIARIANLQAQGAPLYCIIGSSQAKMDLQIRPIELSTGELVGVGADGS